VEVSRKVEEGLDWFGKHCLYYRFLLQVVDRVLLIVLEAKNHVSLLLLSGSITPSSQKQCPGEFDRYGPTYSAPFAAIAALITSFSNQTKSLNFFLASLVKKLLMYVLLNETRLLWSVCSLKNESRAIAPDLQVT